MQDCVSIKGNSSNIFVKNVTCYESGAMCIGSLGNPASTPDYVDNVVFEDITAIHSSNAAWIKTYPGTGHVRNISESPSPSLTSVYPSPPLPILRNLIADKHSLPQHQFPRRKPTHLHLPLHLQLLQLRLQPPQNLRRAMGKHNRHESIQRRSGYILQQEHSLYRTQVQGYRYQAEEWGNGEDFMLEYEQGFWVGVYGDLSEWVEAAVEWECLVFMSQWIILDA